MTASLAVSAPQTLADGLAAPRRTWAHVAIGLAITHVPVDDENRRECMEQRADRAHEHGHEIREEAERGKTEDRRDHDREIVFVALGTFEIRRSRRMKDEPERQRREHEETYGRLDRNEQSSEHSPENDAPFGPRPRPTNESLVT